MGDEKRKGGKMTRVNTRSDVSEQLLIKAEIVTRVSSLTSSLITESRASPSFFFFVQSSMMSDHSCLPCSSAEATFTNPVCTIGTLYILYITDTQSQRFRFKVAAENSRGGVFIHCWLRRMKRN